MQKRSNTSSTGPGRGQGGQKPAKPTPLSWADPALRCQRACPTAFSWHLYSPRELPPRNCHSFLYPPPVGFTPKVLHRHPNSSSSTHTHSAQDPTADYAPGGGGPAQIVPILPSPTIPPKTVIPPLPEPSPPANPHTHIFTNVLGLYSLVGSVSWVQHPKHQPRRAAQKAEGECEGHHDPPFSPQVATSPTGVR